MAITDKNLLLERPHPISMIGGVQRIYRFKNNWGLSAVNSPIIHYQEFPCAWEIAVLKNVNDNGKFETLAYDTELTSDVEIFDSDEEANAFIDKAEKYFNQL